MSSACWSRPRCRTRPAASITGLRAERLLAARGRRAADARPGAAAGHCRRPSRCSSTAARACRGASTSCARPRAGCVGTCAPDDRMIVAPFSPTLEPITGPTDDRATVAEAIAAIRPSGGTAILDSLADAARHASRASRAPLRHPAHRRLRRAQQTTLDDALRGAAADQAHGLRRRHRRRRRHLAQGRDAAAGASPRRPAAGRSSRRARTSCPTCTALVAADVHSRYLLTYTPTNQEVDGAWRAIRLAIDRPGLHGAQPRPGYFAPKPPPVRPTIEFTSLDASAATQLDCRPHDLVVVEDGVPQTVETFQEASGAGVDRAGARRQRQHAAGDGPVKAAARAFVEALRPDDPLALVLFSDRVEFAHELTTERQTTLEAIDRLDAQRRHGAVRRPATIRWSYLQEAARAGASSW